MDKLSQEQLTMVKMAAFVDELVKIAIATNHPELIDGVYDALTGDQLLLLKQAGLLDRIGAGAGALASKAKGAIQSLGEGGAARRMAAAGKEHDVLKNMMAPSTMRSSPIGPAIHRGSGLPKPFAVSEEGAHLAMLPQMKDNRTSYMLGGKMHGPMGANMPAPSAAEVSLVEGRRAGLRPPNLSTALAPEAATAAAAPAAAAAAPAKAGIMDRLRAAILSGGGLQPAFAT